MRVRYLVSMAGPLYAVQPGDVREIDAAEAARLFNAGFAEPAPALPETATLESGEAAITKPGKPKKGGRG